MLKCSIFLPFSLEIKTESNTMKHTELTLFIHHLKHTKVMNKTVKIILQAISYIITLILGAAGGATVL